MGLFDFLKNKESVIVNGDELIEKHKQGKLNDEAFLKAFSQVKVYYSTPYGNHTDGSQKVFLLMASDKTGLLPVFTSIENAKKFYDTAGRVDYMLMEGTYLSVLQTTQKINEGSPKPPIPIGLVIEPEKNGAVVSANILKKVIEVLLK